MEMDLATLESRFVPAKNGPFLKRDGPARAANLPKSNKKLCFTATDKAHLVRLLYELSERPDCWFVKYSIEPRDGMYLGRAFFTEEQTVGKLWNDHAFDPKVFCSVQDDDWTAAFRA